MNKYFRYICIAIVISTFLACKEKGLSIVGLHCDYMENPLGVDKQTPFLQWQLSSSENDRSLADIKPDTANPGMKHFYIEPKPASDLKFCKASYISLYGEIISDWAIDKEGNFSIKVTVPANTSATIVLPKWGRDSEEKSVTVQSGMHNFTVSK